jgi:tetratricopeptide (TPR) repeat protein
MKLALRTLFVVVALQSALVGDASAAASSAEEQARKAFVRGEQLFRAQKFHDAAAAFEEGHRLAPSPAFLYDLALTYRALNKPEQAISYYQAYLKAQPGATDRAAVETAIAEEQRKLAKAPPPAAKTVDKAAFAATTAPTSTSPSHKEAGKSPEKVVEKAPEKAAAKVPEKAVGEPPEKTTDVVLVKSDRPTEQPIYRKWWFWTATGAVVVGAVAIGLGVGLTQPGTEPYREVTWR